MAANPFKVGDKVYHVEFGLVEIEHLIQAGASVKANLEGGQYSIWAPFAVLSFSPWLPANHVRPA